jgi:hypothetical protein
MDDRSPTRADLPTGSVTPWRRNRSTEIHFEAPIHELPLSRPGRRTILSCPVTDPDWDLARPDSFSRRLSSGLGSICSALAAPWPFWCGWSSPRPISPTRHLYSSSCWARGRSASSKPRWAWLSGVGPWRLARRRSCALPVNGPPDALRDVSVRLCGSDHPPGAAGSRPQSRLRRRRRRPADSAQELTPLRSRSAVLTGSVGTTGRIAQRSPAERY